MEVDVDVAVVGGGIAGMSVAAELSRDSTLRIAVLEQEQQLAYHSTGRSAAAFLESYGSAEIRALTRASRPLFDADPPILTNRALLWVANSDNVAEIQHLLDTEPLLRAVGESEARTMCPALRPGWAVAGAVEDGARDIDVAALFERYRRLALHNGVAIRTGDGLRRASTDGRSWSLETDTARLRAEIVVNAAGAWADDVATRCGAAPIGLTPLRRTVAVVTCGAAQRFWPLVADAAEGFYFRPESGGLLLSPADETASEPCDARADDLDVALALDRANEATTLNLRHVTAVWAGLRTFAPDRNPVVGFDVTCPGFFWLAGQGGYGMQTAPALAQLAAALVRGDAAPAGIVAQGLDSARIGPARYVGGSRVDR